MKLIFLLATGIAVALLAPAKRRRPQTVEIDRRELEALADAYDELAEDLKELQKKQREKWLSLVPQNGLPVHSGDILEEVARDIERVEEIYTGQPIHVVK